MNKQEEIKKDKNSIITLDQFEEYELEQMRKTIIDVMEWCHKAEEKLKREKL